MKRFTIFLAVPLVLAGCASPLISSKPAATAPRVLTAAQTYGIKIIVDAVLNHVADNGTSGQFDHAVDSSIANDSYFHNQGNVGDWSNRYQVTQQNLGNGPDWNTQNSYVQSLHLAFLNQAIADGAGGSASYTTAAAGQNVTQTVNVGSSSLSAVVQ